MNEKQLVWIILHILAISAIFGGVYRAVHADPPELASSLMSQYILWAILFELFALNFKELK